MMDSTGQTRRVVRPLAGCIPEEAANARPTSSARGAVREAGESSRTAARDRA
ncbi:hypothetical protein [Rubricoccus marinus]|uniref:hypothetical protein n=1 Tax=Rubricoccus marinus TaxID=716817 RepID=UPI0015C595FE|nr:hypothetical protein [Rubricoccus marinus]